MKTDIFKSISHNILQVLGISSVLSTPEEKAIRKNFMDFLNVEDCIFCYKMIEEGYTPPSDLKNKLNTLMVEKITAHVYSDQEIEQIKNIPPDIRIMSLLENIEVENDFGDFFNAPSKKKTSHSEKYIVDLFKTSEYTNLYYKYIINKIKSIEEHYENNVNIIGVYDVLNNEHLIKTNNNMLYITGVLIRNAIFNDEQTQQIKTSLKNLDKVIKSKTSDTYQKVSFQRIGKRYFDTFVEGLQNYQLSQLSNNDNKKNVIRQIKSFSSRNKTLNEEMSALVVNEQYSVEDLPNVAQEKVKSIMKTVEKINQEDVTVFVKLRLPVILKKYFSIDEEYRIKMKSVEGFNATELMVQSLDNIERIVTAKQEDNNYDLLSELSIENRKLKVKV